MQNRPRDWERLAQPRPCLPPLHLCLLAPHSLYRVAWSSLHVSGPPPSLGPDNVMKTCLPRTAVGHTESGGVILDTGGRRKGQAGWCWGGFPRMLSTQLISDSLKSGGQPQPQQRGVIDAPESVATSPAAPKRGFGGRKSCPRWSLCSLPAAQLSSEISPCGAERSQGAQAFPRNHVRAPHVEEGA
jgi:hypothetical protein